MTIGDEIGHRDAAAAVANRRYHVYALLGSPEETPLWHWAAWEGFAAALDPLVRTARAEASVESHQGWGPIPFFELPFGSLGWSDRDHKRWTHRSPTNGLRSRMWRFLSTEVWSPSRAVCARQKSAPDFYFAMRTEGFFNEETLRFDPAVVVALAADISWGSGEHAALRQITSMPRTWKLAAYQIRSWAKHSGPFIWDSLTDLLDVGKLFGPGPRHQRPVALPLLDGTWTDLTDLVR